jgi:ribA/ribD-fused uncharacterized protein
MKEGRIWESPDMIGFYEGRFYCFSNFASFAVVWHDILWQTSEHAYQAAKFTDPKIVHLIRDARSAHDAKQIAHQYNDRVREDWDQIKVYLMEDICLNKLRQHPFIAKSLLKSGNRVLVEVSPKDDFWGWGPNKDGRNELGKIWMKLRDELKTSLQT